MTAHSKRKKKSHRCKFEKLLKDTQILRNQDHVLRNKELEAHRKEIDRLKNSKEERVLQMRIELARHLSCLMDSVAHAVGYISREGQF